MELPPPATSWSLPTLSTPTWELVAAAAAPLTPPTPRGLPRARSSSSSSSGGGSSSSHSVGIRGAPPPSSVAGRHARVARLTADALAPAAVDALQCPRREASAPLHEHLLAAYVFFFAAGGGVTDACTCDGGGGGATGDDGKGPDGFGTADAQGGKEAAAVDGGRLVASLAAAHAAGGLDEQARVLAAAVPRRRRAAVLSAIAAVGGALESACVAGGGVDAVATRKMEVLDEVGGAGDAAAAAYAWEAVKGRF